MPRPLRIFAPGYWYHVAVKGQRGQPLFFSPDDRVKYLQLLDEVLFRQGGALGAFALMTNHAHFLLRQDETDLNKVYQSVNSGYARYFNEKRNTSGHVFQGRPVCKIILGDSYLTTLVGYIHNNPVKAGLVSKAGDYKWDSSYWYLGKKCPWIKLKTLELPPGFEGSDCNKKFFEAIGHKEYVFENKKNYLGSDEQWSSLQKKKQKCDVPEKRRERRSMDAIASQCCLGTGYTVQDLKGRSRGRELSKIRHAAMAKIYEEGYGYSETGKYFNRTFRIAVSAYKKYGNGNKS